MIRPQDIKSRALVMRTTLITN